MGRTPRTIVSIVGIILGAMLASLITYYVGESFGTSIVAANSQLDYEDWIDEYKGLVNIMTVLMMIIGALYYLILRFASKITFPDDGGKRMFWAVFFTLTLIISLVFPYIYAVIEDDFINGLKISLLFVVIYGLLYFWLGSLFITPPAYKYSPLGATVVRK